MYGRAKRMGKTYTVLIENKSFDGKYYIGRTMQDAPEIDGLVYIPNYTNKDLINQFISCKIVDVKDYDLIGNLL